MSFWLYHGSSLDLMPRWPEASVDSIVTDPPYELGFMAKKWDASGIAYSVELWRGALRMLKPGGHLLAFGGTRTYHRMVCAIEDAGFEVRDSIDWIYGSGFPKSLTANTGMPEGRGTALKPAHEPIVLARKPLEGTVAANVLAHGTGGLNIDGCRIEGRERTDYGLKNSTRTQGAVYGAPSTSADFDASQGRWPSNILLDEAAAAELDAKSGLSKSSQGKPRGSKAPGEGWGMTATGAEYADSGGASRFFYVAKPSRKERDLGCEHLTPKTGGEATGREDGSAGTKSPRAGAGRTGGARNYHPTVKPITLMRYLVRMVTPPDGVVFDPFLGSGTTGVAARLEGLRFVGVDIDEGYLEIAHARLNRVFPG